MRTEVKIIDDEIDGHYVFCIIEITDSDQVSKNDILAIIPGVYADNQNKAVLEAGMKAVREGIDPAYLANREIINASDEELGRH
jgi:hypothetical protein